jgi:hypothetical protein
MIGLFIATLVTVVVTSIYVGEQYKKYLKDHWSELRCNPLYMPLASYAGYDISQNLVNCVTKSFSDYAGLGMDGMNSQMSLVTDTLGTLNDSMDDMRGMMGTTRGGFMMVFQMVFGKIANLMGSMQYLMIRIRTLMGRIVGVFASLIYAFYAGEQTGQAVWNGPIGETARIL